MVSTSVGQKCPDCARQTGRARGNPDAARIARVFGVTLAAGAAGGYVLVLAGFRFLFILGALYGFAVAAAGRWAAGGRVHSTLATVTVAGMLTGLVVMVLLVGASPLAPPIIITAAIASVVAFVRAAGIR
jgi:hypothetical protein